MDKESKKLLRRQLGWIFLRVFTFISGALSLRWSYLLGDALGKIVYTVVLRHRRIARESLSIAFPNISQHKRRKIALDFFVFMIQSSFELLHFLRHPQKLEAIRIEGRENLDKAMQRGKGIILLTAHLGNFPLMILKLAKEGYPAYAVARPMRDKRAGDYIHSLRTKAGVKTIFSYPRRECVSGIIKALRENGLVAIQMDQNFGSGGVWVKFFGKLAATPVGSIVFALRTNTAVIPAYIYREERGKHCIRLFPQEELIVTDNKDETILLNAVKFSRIIESWIRKFPSQWSWNHRRWKSRPSEEVRKLKFKVEGE